MSREFFCSYCGTPLRLKRKALKNRAIIVDLIEPHECDESNVKNITDSEKPVSPIIKQFHEAERRAAMPIINEDDKVFFDARTLKDRRESVHQPISTAPAGLTNALKGMLGTGAERPFTDLDKDDPIDEGA